MDILLYLIMFRVRNSCRFELCDYSTPCGMDRGHPVVFRGQMGWFEKSKMASLMSGVLGMTRRLGSAGSTDQSITHTAPPAWRPQSNPQQLRVPRVSSLANKVKASWPFITWPLKSHNITFAVLCGGSSHKPTQIRQEGHRPLPLDGRKGLAVEFYSYHFFKPGEQQYV